MSRSSQILVVTFDPSTEVDPLTVITKELAESVEQYLQRIVSGPVDVSVANHEDRGLATQDGRLIASFTFAPLGGAR